MVRGYASPAPVPSGLRDVAVVGVGTTPQTKIAHHSAVSLCLQAASLALVDAGMAITDVDGISARWPGPGGTVFHPGSVDWTGLFGIPVRWVQDTYPQGVPAALDAAAAIQSGLCHTVLVIGGQAAIRSQGAAVADYTRPSNEFVEPFGAFTQAHFALLAQRYLHEHPDVREDVAHVAATIRNHGHRNPDAVLAGRGPYSADDVLASALIATPLRLLDVCLATEGAAAMVLTRRDRAVDTRAPVWLLSGGCEWHRQQYVDPPRYEHVWQLGVDAAQRSFAAAGIAPTDVDVAQLYDINSFEVVRQLEALGYADRGQGPAFARETGLGLDGGLPTNTDGGLLSYAHLGWGGPTLKISEAVHQLRGEASGRQVRDAEVALVTGAGAGAQYHNLLLLGADR